MNISSFGSRFIPSATLFLSAALVSAPAAAQLEEIIVTAQKREQSLQDVPITISALTGAQFDLFNVARADDLEFVFANVGTNRNSGGNTGISIRGVGTDNVHLSGQQSVGTVGGSPAGRGSAARGSRSRRLGACVRWRSRWRPATLQPSSDSRRARCRPLGRARREDDPGDGGWSGTFLLTRWRPSRFLLRNTDATDRGRGQGIAAHTTRSVPRLEGNELGHRR